MQRDWFENKTKYVINEHVLCPFMNYKYGDYLVLATITILTMIKCSKCRILIDIYF